MFALTYEIRSYHHIKMHVCVSVRSFHRIKMYVYVTIEMYIFFHVGNVELSYYTSTYLDFFSVFSVDLHYLFIGPYSPIILLKEHFVLFSQVFLKLKVTTCLANHALFSNPSHKTKNILKNGTIALANQNCLSFQN